VVLQEQAVLRELQELAVLQEHQEHQELTVMMVQIAVDGYLVQLV
jgi:hypothetical protein